MAFGQGGRNHLTEKQTTGRPPVIGGEEAEQVMAAMGETWKPPVGLQNVAFDSWLSSDGYDLLEKQQKLFRMQQFFPDSFPQFCRNSLQIS